ncbi:MAG TPA: hypothetical protein ENN80_06870 [Candidatus Hydrogenedentes bacterium]|nr:hypothetical protein [Candidatus Hydrogenedentota bacterium]
MTGTCEHYERELAGFAVGMLGEEEHRRLLDHIEVCPVCRAEYQWLKTTVADIEVIGEALAECAPQVDLVEAVVRGIHDEPRDKLVPFKPRARFRVRWTWFLPAAGLAAAAVLAITWVATHTTPGASPTRLARYHVPEQPPPLREVVKQGREVGSEEAVADQSPQTQNLDEASKTLAYAKSAMSLKSRPGKRLAQPDLATIAVRDVIAARRNRATDPSAGAWLQQWAHLTPAQARDVIASPDASTDAIVGACQALAPEEAVAHLEEAVANAPEEPYFRLVLAKAYAAQDDKQEAAVLELEQVAALDPQNAFPDYVQAKYALEQGDVASAETLLAAADEKPLASSYALKAAACRQEALKVAGIQPETAGLLSALTAGTEEYAAACDIGDELVRTASRYEEAHDFDTARRLYEGVYTLGEKLEQSARLSAVRLAGLDLQRAVVEPLDRIYQALEDSVALLWLEAQVEEFVRGMESLSTFFESLDALFSAEDLPQYINAVSDIILSFGDIEIFDHLDDVLPH